ncbi:tRNA-uridine aminocarboxypropyltransferase [Vibrio mangrovi]|uniref:tRNA-uridine aminocarboxypropyltransferase n=1 Tax=Vibrio mangrovi TaxID=474394 RepID=A0A1Y6IW54_9VIBR|nr:DTW domain-containing protein [Vibrio mangrovi]MDW6002581.1 DTW domain-containing protein [Vibrio mangrovi]SMS01887.1 DTW domain protein [Vibrio mangrovi]
MSRIQPPQTCPRCGLMYQCICQKIPRLSSEVELSLLTHERELPRETNTGRWLVHALPQCHSFLWQRKQPCEKFQQRLDKEHLFPVLLFPSPHALSVNDVSQRAREGHKKPHFILLDGTWQEARKMERKSTWLAEIPRVQITPDSASAYRLRRNQQPDALCTLEVIATLLQQLGEDRHAQALKQFLYQFMDALSADKSGHASHRE